MNINEIKKNLIAEIEKLLKIIKNEYPNLVDIPNNYDLNDMVHVEKTGTISLYVSNKNFYFPLDAFNILNKLKKIPGFGINKKHKTCTKDTMIINNNTYGTYIKHVFLKGLTPEEYYKEILLRETLHFCGSGGGEAIREGINELLTRQLAQKHNLLTSSCGYPKETKIAYELEQIFGEDIIKKIAFAKNHIEIKNILNSLSPNATSFFFNLTNAMEKEFYNKYMKYKFPGLTGPFKKTKKYNSINYTKAYELINEYKREISAPKTTKLNNQLEKKDYQPKANAKIQNDSIRQNTQDIFNYRTPNEISIAQQIRIKNQIITRQNKTNKVKTLTKTNSQSKSTNKGYINITILALIIGFMASILTIIVHSIFK